MYLQMQCSCKYNKMGGYTVYTYDIDIGYVTGLAWETALHTYSILNMSKILLAFFSTQSASKANISWGVSVF
jgi:hypothetical protein